MRTATRYSYPLLTLTKNSMLQATFSENQLVRMFALFGVLIQETGYKLATVLTTVGKQWIVDKLDETLQTTGDYVGWGTGAGTAAAADTTLFTEASEARVVATRSQPATDTVRWVATITADGAKTITNAGNLTASSGGTLIVHGDFTGIVLALNDQIQFTIDLQIT